MTARTYTIHEIARAVGVEPRRVEGWAERGVLTPINTNPGTGNPRRFGYAELVKAGIVATAQRAFGERFLPTSLSVPLRLLHKGDHPVARWRLEEDRTWARFVAPPGESELFIVVDADHPDTTRLLSRAPKPADLGSVSLVIDVNKIKARIADALAA